MYQRIVVKLGTSVLTGGSPQLDHPHMVELVRQCAEMYRQGKDLSFAHRVPLLWGGIGWAFQTFPTR